MKKFISFLVLLLVVMFSVTAQDQIVLQNGHSFNVRIVEVSPTTIKYQYPELHGEKIFSIHTSSVNSYRYENGLQQRTQFFGKNNADNIKSTQKPSRKSGTNIQLGTPTPFQQALNGLPAIPIAGRNLSFKFGGDTWIATINGRNLLAGSIVTEDTDEGTILTLRPTHLYPPRDIPGISWVRTPGPEISLIYRESPLSLRLYRE